MNVDVNKLVAACKKYGQLLHVPSGIDGAQLLWALSGNESAFGANCTPRHEPSYCYITKGIHAPTPNIQQLTHEWGCLAHCSYGCWQVMFSNCISFTPLQMLQDLDAQASAAKNFLNGVVFAVQKAQTLDQIADAYNRGNFKDLATRALQLGIPEAELESEGCPGCLDAAYMTKLGKNYAIPMERSA